MAASLVASLVEDVHPQLSSILMRPYDDGRFIVRVDGNTIWDMERNGSFPDYANDVKPKLPA